jgi:hypothetical protein
MCGLHGATELGVIGGMWDTDTRRDEIMERSNSCPRSYAQDDDYDEYIYNIGITSLERNQLLLLLFSCR